FTTRHAQKSVTVLPTAHTPSPPNANQARTGRRGDKVQGSTRVHGGTRSCPLRVYQKSLMQYLPRDSASWLSFNSEIGTEIVRSAKCADVARECSDDEAKAVTADESAKHDIVVGKMGSERSEKSGQSQAEGAKSGLNAPQKNARLGQKALKKEHKTKPPPALIFNFATP
ncbi:hypothetical protein SARC_10930, partial [Sphaeroforma arctica JP610]